MFIHFFSSLIMKKFSKRVEKTKVTRKDEHFLRKKKKSIMVSTSNTNNYCPDGETEKYEIVYFYSYAPIT